MSAELKAFLAEHLTVVVIKDPVKPVRPLSAEARDGLRCLSRTIAAAALAERFLRQRAPTGTVNPYTRAAAWLAAFRHAEDLDLSAEPDQVGTWLAVTDATTEALLRSLPNGAKDLIERWVTSPDGQAAMTSFGGETT